MENITSIFQVLKMELKHLLQGKTNLFLSKKYNKVQTERPLHTNIWVYSGDVSNYPIPTETGRIFLYSVS